MVVFGVPAATSDKPSLGVLFPCVEGMAGMRPRGQALDYAVVFGAIFRFHQRGLCHGLPTQAPARHHVERSRQVDLYGDPSQASAFEARARRAWPAGSSIGNPGEGMVGGLPAVAEPWGSSALLGCSVAGWAGACASCSHRTSSGARSTRAGNRLWWRECSDRGCPVWGGGSHGRRH